jgi:hypothetical protein
MMIDFAASRHLPVALAGDSVLLGDRPVDARDRVGGPQLGAIDGADLRDALLEYARRTRGGYRPQLAALAFFMTGRPRALDHYFPLTNALDVDEIARFYALAGALAAHPNFDLRLIDEDGTIDILADTAYLVAGQVAEIFFYRHDILDRLLAAPLRVWLYATPRAFAAGGGVAGGCYSPAKGCVQMLLGRLYEGFYDKAPGVAPFLHEFGHLLDHFDAGRAAQGPSRGLLPGQRPSDGAIYTPEARELFLKGKRLEMDRYARLMAGAAPDAALPIGHPYVFQNDTEFIAGYVEMFFRNPHYFARHNPDLFGGFATLLRQDPRRAWAADFPFYVEENRRFYLSGQRPGPTALTIPADVEKG